ncbi:hypothetical protein AB0K92_19500, partial [Streptomyces sp. NPDC052687]|uniref:hypothetical protein n=1 Tax=Streptomyces sp. NPDC052687 TaxID=3154759 RepID=UPI0034228E82
MAISAILRGNPRFTASSGKRCEIAVTEMRGECTDDRPLEHRQVGVQVAADAGQGDAHDRGVQQDH